MLMMAGDWLNGDTSEDVDPIDTTVGFSFTHTNANCFHKKCTESLPKDNETKLFLVYVFG